GKGDTQQPKGFDMSGFFLLLVVVGVVFIAFLLIRNAGSYPYVKAGPLLTPAERNFHKVLVNAIPPGHALTMKVRIGDVLNVKKGLDKKRAMIMRAKIQQKHFDFVLCRTDDYTPVCCIELNDSSHKRRDRAARDEFVRGACAAAGMPLVEVPA